MLLLRCGRVVGDRRWERGCVGSMKEVLYIAVGISRRKGVDLGFVKSCSSWRRRIVARIQEKLANDSGDMLFV